MLILWLKALRFSLSSPGTLGHARFGSHPCHTQASRRVIFQGTEAQKPGTKDHVLSIKPSCQPQCVFSCFKSNSCVFTWVTLWRAGSLNAPCDSRTRRSPCGVRFFSQGLHRCHARLRVAFRVNLWGNNTSLEQ